MLFDLVKNRVRFDLSCRLFSAALAHRIRLVVAQEFIVELERTTKNAESDVVLRLAQQLPRLPLVERDELDRLAATIHDMVFGRAGVSGAGTPRAVSDAKHLAHAALARASGFITSDGTLISARDRLLESVGIDVAGLEELAQLVPPDDDAVAGPASLRGTVLETRSASLGVLHEYFTRHRVPEQQVSEFASSAGISPSRIVAVFEGTDVVGVAALRPPSSIDAAARLLVHVRPDHVACETFADHLLDVSCRQACATAPVTIEMPTIPGQGTLQRVATSRGFLPMSRGETLIKVAIGRPITMRNWSLIARQTRRRTGLLLPEDFPDHATAQNGISLVGPDGRTIRVGLPVLEELLGPTILAWQGRAGVIVPITRLFADELLGTGNQLPLLGSPEAAFLSRRTYVNSPRAAKKIRPGAPILFYESKRSGGRGSIVAIARTIDSIVVPKDQVAPSFMRRVVLEKLDDVSTSAHVLATSFDSVIAFPMPVPLHDLRRFGAVGSVNLQTATSISSESLIGVIERGWCNV